jgi:hypothetical protein
LLRVRALLAAHADAAARTALAGLAGSVAQASVEQRGIDALLRAQLARRAGDRNGETEALADARKLAQASGVKLLQLEVALQTTGRRIGPGTELDVQSALLGHVALRLGWLEAAMRQALDERDAATATRLYREAQPLLRRGDFVAAHALHTLGSRALAMQGDTAASAIAAGHAHGSLQALRAHIPAELRGDFDAALAALAAGT